MIEKSGIEQCTILIKHYLREQPVNNSDDFAVQAARALWLEQRYFENMAKVFGSS